MEQSEAMMMVVVMPIMFGAMAWAFKLALAFLMQQRRTKLAYEIQNKVIDKFGTAPEAMRYLESEAGSRLLESAESGPTNPKSRILNSVQAGVILSALGIGFLLVKGFVPEGAEAFPFVGILVLCLGIGFLVSSAIAYMLSKSWGLITVGSDSSSSDV